MELVLPLALRVGLLLYCFIVPGWALLGAAGFTSASKLDRILACLAAGAATTSLTVTTLLLAGVYFRVVTIVLLIAPLAYLVWRARTGGGAGMQQSAVSSQHFPVGQQWPGAIDRAVVIAATGFLLVYLVDAWTSPITWWDGLASWGKWAADWGRRTSSAHYVVGGYPQLVPRIVSVMYKLTGASTDLLPLDFFALHGVYVLFAAWFLVAAVRLSQQLDLPAWPVVLAGLGSIQFREHAGAGTVDVLVSAMVATLLALYFGLRRGTWSARRESLVLGAAALATIFTKWTGAIGILLMLILHYAARYAIATTPERTASLTRTVRNALALAAVGMLPFLLEQGISEVRIGRWEPDPSEVNISLRQIPALLSTDANIVFRGGDAGVQAGLIQLRFWNSYDVPATLRLVFTVMLALCVLASATSWFGRAALPVLIVYGAIWLHWSSYDQRNVFGLLPILALCAAFGGRWLWGAWPRLLWPNAIAIFGGVFLILAGGGLLKDAQARIAAMTRGDQTLPARLAAMRGDIAGKVTLFYPQLDVEYRFISALSQRSDATHVLVTYPLFRFFDRGAHALSLWPYNRVRSGDVFASHSYHTPPDDPRWVLLSRHPDNRVWLYVEAIRPVTPTQVSPGSGVTRWLLADVVPADFGSAGFIVWRATGTHEVSRATAIFEAFDGLRLDSQLVSTACEPPRGGRTGFSCSGVVALERGAVAAYRAGQLKVGIETDDDPADVTLTFAQPLPPAAPPR